MRPTLSGVLIAFRCYSAFFTEHGMLRSSCGLLVGTAAGDPDFVLETAAPELKTMALAGEDPHDRMAAVIALTRAASTPSAQAALVEVAQQSTDPKVKQSAGSIVSGLLGARPK